ncbi:MAG: amidohydrolase family protein [Acidobacteriota bacterium]|nr:amidohydrolase family protein [Acidobacteriota bacterium]
MQSKRNLVRLAVVTITLVSGLIATPALAREAIAFVGAHLIPIDGPPIEDGVLVISEGSITAVGTRDRVRIPKDAQIIDAAGQTIMPGLVDTHSHVGGGWAADRSAPIQPDVSVYDSINVRDSGFRRALAGGVTTANVMPGSGHLMSGQTVYVKHRAGNTIDEWVWRDDGGRPLGGMKMANGTNSRRDPPFPGTRGKSAALVREQFVAALDYRRKLEAAGDDAEKVPDRDLAMEALLEVLDGTRMVHHHTHRHDDIMTILRLREEFGFRVVLHHVSDAWKVADEIAAAGVPSSLILVDSPGGKLEAMHIGYESGGVLEKAGAAVAFHTDDWITDSRLFLRMAALAVRGGMSREGALEALTLAPAQMMDLGDRIGSLTVGKDADFVILDGDPFSVYTKVLETWVDGDLRFDRSDEKDRLWAVGGYGAGQPRAVGGCCQRMEEE